MKHLLQVAASIFMIRLVAFTSCEKEKKVAPVLNKAPYARAGENISVSPASCSDRSGTATLDGSGSIDYDNNITNYRWTQFDGPNEVIIQDPTSAKTRIENISVGNYTFRLEVRDAYGFLSNDDVLVTATGPAQDYDLELTTEAAYRFTDNFEDCYYGCTYYDLTQINGKGTFAPIGAFNIYILEYADTASVSDAHNTFFNMYSDNGNIESLGGSFSINLKKLIQDGGGAFTGTLKVEGGSATFCGDNRLNDLPLLNVSGILDVATGMIKLTIKGKVLM